MRHKLKTVAFTSPFNLFSQMFCAPMWFGAYTDDVSAATPAWEVFFVASPMELYDELVWACGRPESRAKGVCSYESCESFSQDHQSNDAVATTRILNAFYQALTVVEVWFYGYYASKYAGQVYSLNQNPDITSGMSGWDYLHTIIKNAGILWLLGDALPLPDLFASFVLYFTHNSCDDSIVSALLLCQTFKVWKTRTLAARA